MKVIVTGGAGFLGGRVIGKLLDGLDQGISTVEYDQIVSVDLAPCPLDDPRVISEVGDIADQELLHRVVGDETAGVFHLAAVLSGGSEVDFDGSMRVNVDGTRALLEACRHGGTVPRFVFTSSLAVFGGEMPQVVPETLATRPESTYGSFKAIGELLVNEYSRKGFVDGRVCRLPTISVRPGRPNSAASSFASGIIREPLNAEPSVVPVPLDTRLWLSSPNTAVANLIHAFEIAGDQIGQWRTLNLPGVCVTVGEMLDALTEVGGQQARDLVSYQEDPRIMDIVCSWPGEFDVSRPLALGFIADASFVDAVRQYRDEFVDGVKG